jgi:putative transposase
MSVHGAEFPIATMARVFGVSPSGFHAWRSRPASAHAASDAALLRRIRTIHAASHGTYGAPRVHAELQAEATAVARKRVARLMRGARLRGVSRRRSPTTTQREPSHWPANDLVGRDFRAAGPNQLWVADITYVPSAAGFLFLAVVLDVWSRRIAWLGHGHRPAHAPGARCTRHGGDDEEARRCRSPLGPGQPIHVRGVRFQMQGSWRPTLHRLGR